MAHMQTLPAAGHSPDVEVWGATLILWESRHVADGKTHSDQYSQIGRVVVSPSSPCFHKLLLHITRPRIDILTPLFF